MDEAARGTGHRTGDTIGLVPQAMQLDTDQPPVLVALGRERQRGGAAPTMQDKEDVKESHGGQAGQSASLQADALDDEWENSSAARKLTRAPQRCGGQPWCGQRVSPGDCPTANQGANCNGTTAPVLIRASDARSQENLDSLQMRERSMGSSASIRGKRAPASGNWRPRGAEKSDMPQEAGQHGRLHF